MQLIGQALPTLGGTPYESYAALRALAYGLRKSIGDKFPGTLPKFDEGDRMSELRQARRRFGAEERGPIMSNIFQRIHAVMTELDSVAKTRRTNHGDKFLYVGHDDVTEKLQPLFVKHGIVQRVSIDELTRDAQQMVCVKVIISWCCIDMPESEHSVSTFGESAATRGIKEGSPRGDDLQVGKAVSYAVKTAQLKNFCLVGDTTPDNEAEQPSEPVRGKAPVENKPKDPVADSIIDAIIGTYEGAKSRADLDAVRDEVDKVMNRITQAQEDKLAAADQAAAERINRG